MSTQERPSSYMAIFFLRGTTVYIIYEYNCRDITEILLKVMLNTITTIYIQCIYNLNIVLLQLFVSGRVLLICL